MYELLVHTECQLAKVRYATIVGPHASIGTVEHKVNALHKNSKKKTLDVAQNLRMP